VWFCLVIPSPSTPPPKTALTVAIVQASLGAAGVLAPGTPNITLSGFAPARFAAISPAEVATLADEKDLSAPAARDFPELHSHPSGPRRSTLDNPHQR